MRGAERDGSCESGEWHSWRSQIERSPMCGLNMAEVGIVLCHFTLEAPGDIRAARRILEQHGWAAGGDDNKGRGVNKELLPLPLDDRAVAGASRAAFLEISRARDNGSLDALRRTGKIDWLGLSKRCWLYVMVLTLNSLYLGPSAWRRQQMHTRERTSAAQGVALDNLRADVDHLLDLHKEVVPTKNWHEELKNRRLDYCGGTVAKAEDITWEQIEPALPKAGLAGCVDFSSLASGEMRRLLRDPTLLVKPRSEWPAKLKKAKFRVQDAHRREVAMGLVERGICKIILDEEVPTHNGVQLLQGGFGVGKGKTVESKLRPGTQVEVLRLIINAIPTNEVQTLVAGDNGTLPFVGQWLGLELDDEEELVWCSDDECSAFYLFAQNKEWHKWFALNLEVDNEWFGIRDGRKRRLAVAVLAMGWQSATGFFQYGQRRLITCPPPLGAGLPAVSEIRRDRPLPLDSNLRVMNFWQNFLDNFDAGSVRKRGSAALKEALRLAPKCAVWQEAYRSAAKRHGIPLAEDKALVLALEAQTLGSNVFGSLGRSYPRLDKEVSLIGLSFYLMGLSRPTRKEVSIVGGGWVFFFQFRRPCMSVFDDLWGCARGNLARGLRPVALATELLRAISLLPLMYMDFRAKVSGLTTVSDASESGGGVCEAVGCTAVAARLTGAQRRKAEIDRGLDTVALVEGFGGIGGARRACELLRVRVAAHLSIENDESARRVVQHAWPEVNVMSDIRQVEMRQLKAWALQFPHVKHALYIWGSPCSDLTGLRFDRQGLEGPTSNLLHDGLRVGALVKDLWADSSFTDVLENVASMGPEDRERISKLRGTMPVRMNAREIAGVSRPRLYWLNFKLPPPSASCMKDVKLVVGDKHVMVKFPDTQRPVSSWLPKGFRVDKDFHGFHTFTQGQPRKHPPPNPASFKTTSKEAIRRWELDCYRFAPYTYERAAMLASRGGTLVQPTPELREDLLCYKAGHSWPAAPAAERADKQKHIDARNRVLGKTFMCADVAWLLGQRFAQLGILEEAPSMQTILDRQSEEKRGDEIETNMEDIARVFMGRQTHRGGEVRLSEGPSGAGRAITQEVDVRCWKWRAVVAARWHAPGEHINALEIRAYGLAVRWRARKHRNFKSKFLHLVDSIVTLGSQAKGRSSSKRTKYIIKRNNAVILAAHFYPVLGFVRTARNPADKVSRRFEHVRAPPAQRKRQARDA